MDFQARRRGKNQEDIPRSKIYSKSLELLARREYSKAELTRKLQSSFAASTLQIDEVIGDLIEQGYLSDRRFAEAYVRSRVGRGYGVNRIRLELVQKGVEGDQIEEALSRIYPSDTGSTIEDTAIFGVWSKKFSTYSSVHDLSYQEKMKAQAKQMRFLVYRGFSQSEIADLFSYLQSENAKF